MGLKEARLEPRTHVSFGQGSRRGLLDDPRFSERGGFDREIGVYDA
jgi:hypothetical protein